MNKFKVWFGGLTLGRKVVYGIIASVAVLALLGANSHDANVSTPKSTNKQDNAASPAQPVPETKTVEEKQAVPFETQTVNDNSLAKGQTKMQQEGINGEKTLTYEVTYLGGKETSRKLVSETVTAQPTAKIIANGTYVAAPTPPPQPAAPIPINPDAGHTAKCNDGTYSDSAHASGTCSHHGGVMYWINHP